MPNEDGQLTDEEVRDFAILLGAKGTDNQCPACKSRRLAMDRDTGFLRLRTALNQGYPLVVITCQNCGYTLFFNVNVLSTAAKEHRSDDGDADAQSE